MFVLVTILGNAPVMGKYEQMLVSRFVLCWQRRRKCRAAAGIGFPCLRSVASMMVESPLTLFF